MKKALVIFFSASLSVLFIGQTVMCVNTLHLLINSEYLVDSSVQIEDNRQEDNFIKKDGTSLQIALNEYFSISSGLHILSGIEPFIWQPPE
ncbi:MAG: hypothetical protein ACOYMF_16210 [Bacteroidales bacterium]